jgi:hypothetical protein
MPTRTSQVRSIITDLHTRLESRGGLAGVTVFRYAPSPKALEGLREHITLALRIDGVQEFLFASHYIKNDVFTLHGVIYVEMSGAGDDIADATHARAEALLAEIEAELQVTPMIGRDHDTLELTNYEHTYGATADDRLHSLTFEIECTARMIST